MKLDSVSVNLAEESPRESKPVLNNIAETNSSVGDEIDTSAEVETQSPHKLESIPVIFATTFATIFLAEIGDKTQLSTLLMSAESHAPWVVFIGSAAALITTSLLGVLVGSWMASRLSPKTVEKAAGVMLLFISLMLFWDVIQI
ncbi:MAG: TMEM165/GDT1 family protein [Nostocaceae cyanobacterium]|nr:TMEM165/GDT1 family protein [Nostocaceae cyanobacterium]